MLCLPYAFWSVCLLRCYFGSQTWNHPNSAHSVFLRSLSFWTWLLGVTQHSIVIPLCPILRCHPLLLSASPSEGIYAPFINGSFRTLCCFKNNFCAHVAPQPRSSRNPRPLQGARPVCQGGRTSLTSRRRTCCWTFLPHVPQWMSTTKRLVLLVGFLGTEVPCWQWTQH